MTIEVAVTAGSTADLWAHWKDRLKDDETGLQMEHPTAAGKACLKDVISVQQTAEKTGYCWEMWTVVLMDG